jgi:hypothetical protein
MSSIGEMPLGAAVVFSSVAGRFGNTGQTDYSAANDLLCKSISSFRNARPVTRGIAIDWTAWAEIGMAARGSIPTVMKQAGIDMLPPEAGIPIVRRELMAGTNGEVVIADRLGMMMQEFDPTGGLDTSDSGALSRIKATGGIMTGRVTSMGIFSGLTIETDLDPAAQPFLYDHQINGTPVLPGVMGIEALAETARLLFPDRHLGTIEDVRFLVPFKFYRGQPRTLILQANLVSRNGDIVADCRLLGSRMLHGQSEPETATHFTARVQLTADPAENIAHVPIQVPHGVPMVQATDIYQLYFHGPAYRVVESSWRSGCQLFGVFSRNLPPNQQPAGMPLLVRPRLIELCFQTAGLWELATRSRMGLPYRIDRVQVLCPVDGDSETLYAVVTPQEGGAFDAQIVDETGRVHLAIEGYRTMELPDPVEPALLEPLRKALTR